MASSISAGTTSSTALVATADTSGALELKTNNGTTALTISTAQAVTFAGTATFPTTLGVGGATPSTSGSGISFPATQSASSDANTLDDYEEGTWTAGVSFGGNAVGVTYTATTGQYGLYTKIGNRVYWSCAIRLTNKGSSTGALKITGLPFTSQSVISYNEAQVIAYYENFVGLTGALNARISNASTTVDITQSSATTCTSITDTFVSNTTYITASGSYAV